MESGTSLVVATANSKRDPRMNREIWSGPCLNCGASNHPSSKCCWFTPSQRTPVPDACSKCKLIAWHAEENCPVVHGRAIDFDDEMYLMRIQELKKMGWWPLKNYKTKGSSVMKEAPYDE